MDKIRNECIRGTAQLEQFGDRQARLRWFQRGKEGQWIYQRKHVEDGTGGHAEGWCQRGCQEQGRLEADDPLWRHLKKKQKKKKEEKESEESKLKYSRLLKLSNHSFIHLSIHFLPLIRFMVIGGLGPIQATIGREVGYTLSRSAIVFNCEFIFI